MTADGNHSDVADSGIKRRRAMNVAAGAVAFLLLLAIAVAGYTVIGRRLDAGRKLDKATVLVEEADSVLVEIDEVVSAEITTGLADDAAVAAKESDTARDKLEEADALIAQAAPSLSEADKERADNLRASALARIDMLRYAPDLLDLNEKASRAMAPGREGWASLLEADGLSQKAVNEYNKLTKAGVSESQRLNKQAAAKLAEAKEKFSAAEKAFPSAAFELYVAYVDTRISINKTSQATDKAWLEGDISTANTLIRKYNTEDPKAVAQFKRLPTSPDAAIGAAYDTDSAASSKAYYAARDRALEADRQLR